MSDDGWGRSLYDNITIISDGVKKPIGFGRDEVYIKKIIIDKKQENQGDKQ